MENVKSFIIKLFDKNNEPIWAYRIYGHCRNQALSIFAQMIIADNDLQYDLNITSKIEIDEE